MDYIARYCLKKILCVCVYVYMYAHITHMKCGGGFPAQLPVARSVMFKHVPSRHFGGWLWRCRAHESSLCPLLLHLRDHGFSILSPPRSTLILSFPERLTVQE